MSDSVTLKEITNDFAIKINKMTDRANLSGIFSRVVYPIYQQLQMTRFQSEGQSEGKSWDSLDPEYEKTKMKKFKSFPGGGRKLLIATSTLAGAVIGKGSHPFFGTDHHRATFTSTQMTIQVDQGGVNADNKKFDYAANVNKKRNFMDFSDTSIKAMKDAIRKFIATGT